MADETTVVGAESEERTGPPRRPFLRSRSHKMIAGICGGLAERLGWSPTTVRVGYILLSLIPFLFPGALVYGVIWLLIPLEPAD